MKKIKLYAIQEFFEPIDKAGIPGQIEGRLTTYLTLEACMTAFATRVDELKEQIINSFDSGSISTYRDIEECACTRDEETCFWCYFDPEDSYFEQIRDGYAEIKCEITEMEVPLDETDIVWKFDKYK